MLCRNTKIMTSGSSSCFIYIYIRGVPRLSPTVGGTGSGKPITPKSINQVKKIDGWVSLPKTHWIVATQNWMNTFKYLHYFDINTTFLFLLCVPFLQEGQQVLQRSLVPHHRPLQASPCTRFNSIFHFFSFSRQQNKKLHIPTIYIYLCTHICAYVCVHANTYIQIIRKVQKRNKKRKRIYTYVCVCVSIFRI